MQQEPISHTRQFEIDLKLTSPICQTCLQPTSHTCKNLKPKSGTCNGSFHDKSQKIFLTTTSLILIKIGVWGYLTAKIHW